MDITVGITTTPDRQDDLQLTIESLRNVGYDGKIHIFAEPGVYRDRLKNTEWYIAKEQLGCFKNFNRMLETLIKIGAKYVWLGQDDFLYMEEAIEKLKEVLELDHMFGYYAMHTRIRMDNYIHKNGWNHVNLGWRAWGMNYVMRTDVAKMMCDHPFYQNHLHTYTKNQQIDSCVSFVLQQLKLPMYYHNPSLSTHIGESVIGHTDRALGQRFYKEVESTMAGIASIPDRVNELKKTINSLYNQVDKIVVGLNGYDEVPEFLKKPGIKVILSDNSLGDAIKFHDVEDFDGYYISVDDDLIYSNEYVKHMIDRIENYKRKAIVGWHGVVVPPNKIETYYGNCVRYNYMYLLPTDNFVNILGTGTVAFHTDTIKLKLSDFRKPNMADIWLGIKAQEQGVPMCCLKRDTTPINTMNTNSSIWEKKHKDDRDITEIVNSIDWQVFYLPQYFEE